MTDIRRHLDPGSLAVIAVTLALFVAAFFVKGLGHDLLLEAGVFLVSVKLIIMTYKGSIAVQGVMRRLDEIHSALARLEGHGEPRRTPERVPSPDPGASAGRRGVSTR